MKKKKNEPEDLNNLRHKSLDNQTQGLQKEDITVIWKTNSCPLSLSPLSFSHFPPESQICVILPRADRRLLRNTSKGSHRKPRVYCRLHLLTRKRNVNHHLCEKPQNSSLPNYKYEQEELNVKKAGRNQIRLFMQTCSVPWKREECICGCFRTSSELRCCFEAQRCRRWDNGLRPFPLPKSDAHRPLRREQV